MGRSIAGLAAALLAACAGIGETMPSMTAERLARYTLLPQPIFLPRGPVRYDCGPEALAAVMAYHGRSVPVEEISNQIYDAERQGTMSPLLAPTAREYGFEAAYRDGSIQRMREAIGQNRPPIAMVRVRDELFHFFVVVGYSDIEQMVLCAEYDGAMRLIGYEEFEHMWREAGWFMLEVMPGTTRSDFTRGADLESDGEYAAAIEWYQRALEKDPEFQPAFVGLGNCRLMLGEISAAEDAYRRAVDLGPNDPRALNNLGQCLVETEDTSEESRVLVERAVRIYETHAARLRAEYEAAAGERERADTQSRLGRIELEMAFALGTLAQIRTRDRQHALAISAWKASYDLLPLTFYDLRAERLEQIAGAYEELGIRSQAVEFLEQALRAAEDGALRDRIVALLERLR